MISNGALYFTDKVQRFLTKYQKYVSFDITVDGPEDVHDACRKYFDGTGNFKDAYAAMMDLKKFGWKKTGTKVTIAPENLSQLGKIVAFFRESGVTDVAINPIFEHLWTIQEAQTYYLALKQFADDALQDKNFSINAFSSFYFRPLHEKDNNNWCGGVGSMLAISPDGKFSPCLRYMGTSLGTTRQPIIVGDVNTGLYSTDEQKAIRDDMAKVTRRSQSTDECFNCPIATGCAWCSAWNYQETGSYNKRSTNICNMHKARSLANVYYWNKYYIQNKEAKYFHRWLPDDEALKYISKEELSLLDKLENDAKNRQKEDLT